MVHPLKQEISRFLEIHVCTPVDNERSVNHSAYNIDCKAYVMNRLTLARRTQIIHCLVEGNSIRSTERMTDTHRDTIMRLLVEVGTGCAKLMDEQMRDLPCRRIQVDEIWAYVGKKQAHLQPGDNRARLGDMWTFVALDPETKLIPTYRIGKRTRDNAVAFM